LFAEKKTLVKKTRVIRKRLGLDTGINLSRSNLLNPILTLSIGYQQKITFYPGLDKV